MKIRNIMLCLVLVLTAGCTAAETDAQSALQRKLAEAESGTVPAPTFHKDYYAYYAEPSVGRISATATGNVFMYDGCFIVMNLDIPSILKEEGTETKTVRFSGGTEAASAEGVFTDSSGAEHPYAVRISMLDDRHYVFLQTDVMQFYAVCDLTAAPTLAAEMLKIARSVTIEKTAIATAFRSSDGIFYAGETIELFDSITPENGSIEELFPDPVVPDDFNQDTAGGESEKN